MGEHLEQDLALTPGRSTLTRIRILAFFDFVQDVVVKITLIALLLGHSMQLIHLTYKTFVSSSHSISVLSQA